MKASDSDRACVLAGLKGEIDKRCDYTDRADKLTDVAKVFEGQLAFRCLSNQALSPAAQPPRAPLRSDCQTTLTVS